MKINLTAIIKANPAHTDAVQQVLQNMVVQSKKEAACLQYDLHQSTESPNIFIFHEVWENDKGFALHNEQSYIKAFGKIVSEKLQEPPTIYITTVI